MMPSDELRVIFLGGVGEIGKNMCVLECGDDIVVIDAGLKFPENDMLGIDIVIPDYSYLAENQDRIRGLVFTHGHEDHVGGLPYLLRDVQVPRIYATPLTLGFIRAKLSEWDTLAPVDSQTVQAGDVVHLGCFTIEFIQVNHSTPDAVGLGIETPAGIVVHTGDFKIDHTPVDGRVFDAARFTAYGDRGVLLLITDSTNAEKPGYVLSERTVGEKFRSIFSEAPGRVVVSTFASNIHRAQQVFDVSAQCGRKVCVDGRSMIRNVDVATELGYLKYDPGLRIDVGEVPGMDPRAVTILTTGSQGEPMSVLVRMSNDDHRYLTTEKDDTVILSATPIPGNEALIWRTVNNLYRQGARVIYSAIEAVHVSGHANQEELKLMLSMVRPKYVVPFHGEPRHQWQYTRLAKSMGYAEDRILILSDYDVLTISERGAAITEKIPGEPVFVDGEGVGDVGRAVLRDRRILSDDGIVFVAATIDDKTCTVADGPVIETRGFVHVQDSGDLLEQAMDLVGDVVEGARDDEDLDEIETRVKRALQKLFREQTGRRPMVIPVLFAVDAPSATGDRISFAEAADNDEE